MWLKKPSFAATRRRQRRAMAYYDDTDLPFYYQLTSRNGKIYFVLTAFPIP